MTSGAGVLATVGADDVFVFGVSLAACGTKNVPASNMV